MRILMLAAALLALAACERPAPPESPDQSCVPRTFGSVWRNMLIFPCTGAAYGRAKAAYNATYPDHPIMSDVELQLQVVATTDPKTKLFVVDGTVQIYTPVPVSGIVVTPPPIIVPPVVVP